ncbi:oxidative stress-induced growth inhibitor 2-like [Cylas formicarius]|uniref:oxidative stress-induced growth inhibitor 2-like n=1 Tax=Cylas formicarius TaxID=197179 RepID=UPI0029585F06|nr:oxidative stress-induced growth inhibitor 2-like [Cylas formicarius]
MRNREKDSNIIYKEVVVVGNGPSGIVVSLMLSGWLPYLISDEHPDEMLSARLKNYVGKCLVTEDLWELARGLEGRSQNPISLLLDALLHPYADIGLKFKSLVEFRKTGVQIDHVVLGKGPPGGSWHRMDPDVLTLSLGSWMALPGIPFPSSCANEKRAYARDVAAYYEHYVRKMGLGKNFKSNVLVTSVTARVADEGPDPWSRKFDKADSAKTYVEPPRENHGKSCFIADAIHCLFPRDYRSNKRSNNGPHSGNCNRRLKTGPGFVSKHERKKELCCCCCCCCRETNDQQPRRTSDFHKKPVPFYSRLSSPSSCDTRSSNWLVRTDDVDTVTYACKYLVLACGTYDMPNRLEVLNDDPDWLVHDLRALELKLDEMLKLGKVTDPVLIAGAGLSAADAVIATRARGVPVVHVFRNKTAEFSKQLPENMYPEYHKVNQMMKDGGASYPLYKSYPEYDVTDVDQNARTVTLSSKTGERIKMNVSLAAVLIGSRPDLSFLPPSYSLGVRDDQSIDSKTNPVRIDPLTHQVLGYDGLFAVGPLAGDNFVRFIPGGALALISKIYKSE